MPIAVTHTVVINQTEDDPGGEVFSYDKLFDWLVRKAEFPIDYVPAITDCRIVERYPDGFLREAVFYGEDAVLERVTPRRDRYSVRFEVVDDPKMTEVRNELDRDAEGRYTYTLVNVLSDRTVTRIREVAGVLEQVEQAVLETAVSTAATLRKAVLGETVPASAPA
ncbi:AtaL-like protein [Streptomyces sp. NPDC050560]|uniref:AtaL-like protein n=1 Tax=Streptomyces sp. NPDC050560 TaxID=3365630 RepID=UPI003794DB5D